MGMSKGNINYALVRDPFINLMQFLKQIDLDVQLPASFFG